MYHLLVCTAAYNHMFLGGHVGFLGGHVGFLVGRVGFLGGPILAVLGFWVVPS